MFLQTDHSPYGRRRRRSSRRHSLLLLLLSVAFAVLGLLLLGAPQDPHDKLDQLGAIYLGISGLLLVLRLLIGIRHEWRARRSREIREKIHASATKPIAA